MSSVCLIKTGLLRCCHFKSCMDPIYCYTYTHLKDYWEHLFNFSLMQLS